MPLAFNEIHTRNMKLFFKKSFWTIEPYGCDCNVLILIKINFEKNSLFIWCMDFVVSLSSPELATDVHNRLRR